MMSERKCVAWLAVAVALTVGGRAHAALTDGLVGHWKLDDAPGSAEAVDSSGSGNNGTLENMDPSTDWVSGKVDGALDFDGSDDRVVLGNPPALQITGSQTIAMWLRPDVLGGTLRQNPYAKAYGGEGTITVEPDGQVSYYWGTAGGNTTPYQTFRVGPLVSVGAWTHLAIVRDLTAMKLRWYKDGALFSETTANYASATASSLTAYIGDGYTENFDGLIDDLRMYDRALSAAEVLELAGGIDAGLVAHWKFDHASGATATDSSGNGNDGTLHNMNDGDWVPGNDGNALEFEDGGDDYVIRNPFSAFPSTAITVSYWVSTTDSGEGIISYATSSSDNEFLIYQSENIKPHRADSSVNIGVAVNDGAWHHVVVTWRDSDNQVKVYKDGAEVYSGALSAGSIPSGGAFVMGQEQDSVGGGFQSDQAFGGKLDDIRLYSRVLSAAEVQFLFEMGGPPAIWSLVAADPSDDDEVYDVGDTITLSFNKDTNQSMNAETKTGTQMDLLFDLSDSHTWGDGTDQFSLAWTDVRTLVITVDAVSSANIAIGDTITILVPADIQDAPGTSGASTDTSDPMTGDWGDTSPPEIVSVVAADLDNGDWVYGVDDTLTITFDNETNQSAAVTGTKTGTQMNLLFVLSGIHTFGDGTDSFLLEWTPDARTLKISVEAKGSGKAYIGDTITIQAAADIRNAAGVSVPSTDTSPPITGNWGTPPGDGLNADYFTNNSLDGTPAVTQVDPQINYDYGSGGPTCIPNTENFSVRWTGYVRPDYTETYTFYTRTDDGVRLWVNEVKLVDKWVPQSATEWSGSISLTAGVLYEIKMEYYEAGGSAVAELRWWSASQPKDFIPQANLYTVTGPMPPRITSSAPVYAYTDLEFTYVIEAIGNPLPDPAMGDFTVDIPVASQTWLGFDFLQTLSGMAVEADIGTTADITVTVTNAEGSAQQVFQIEVREKRVPVGAILREWWQIGSGNLNSLTTDPDYPLNPDGAEYLTIFEGPVDWDSTYGTRFRGYVHPPQTGEYIFWTSSDDPSDLLLSTDEDPANATRIAYENQWSGSRVWQGGAEQSAPIALIEGARYYIEALHAEGGGGDNIAVGWKLPDGTLERPIPGKRLTPWVDPDTAPIIFSTPPLDAYGDYEYRYVVLAIGNPEDLVYALTSNPTAAWTTPLLFDKNVLSGTPGMDDIGTTFSGVAISVVNGAGTTIADPFDITVYPGAPGMLAWWKLDETADDGTAADSSRFDNTGTLTNMPGDANDWVDVDGRHGLDFDGTDDYVEIGKTATEIGIDGNKPRTVALWCYTRSFNGGALFQCGPAGSAHMFCLRTMSTDNYWRIEYWGGNRDFVFDSKDRWVHFTLAHDSYKTRLYADSALVIEWDKAIYTTDDITFKLGVCTNVNDPTNLGVDDWADFYDGVLSDVYVYDYALDGDGIRDFIGDVPPTIFGSANTVAPVGELYTYKIRACGNPVPTIFVDDSAFPSWLSWDPATDTLSGEPEAADAGIPVPVTATADDLLGHTDTQVFTINVVTKEGSLVCHLKFDDASGLSAIDSSTCGNNGNLDGDCSWAPGVDGGALSSNDAPSNVKVLDHPSLRAQKFTISIWIKPDTVISQMNLGDINPPSIVAKQDESSRTGYLLGSFYMSVDRIGLRIFAGDVNYDVDYNEMTAGQWIHLVGIYDGRFLKLYRNAVPVGFNDIGARTITDDLEPLSVGAYFEGALDDFRLYRWALDENDILDLYNTNPDVPASPPEITSTPRTTAYVGALYSYTITVAGKPTPQITVNEADFPAWLKREGSTLSGTPPAVEVTNAIVVTASNGGADPDDTQEFYISVTDKDADLVAWWRLDEKGGFIAEDSAGDNDGIYTNMFPSTATVTGIADAAIRFDGLDDRVEVGPVGIGGNASRTIMGWVKADFTAHWDWSGMFGFAANVTGNSTYFDIQIHDYVPSGESEGDGIDDYVLNVYGTEYAFTAVDTNWHHLAATHDGTTVKGYLDGLEVFSAGKTLSTSDNFIMGWNPDWNNYFDGTIDDVRVYSRALTAVEIEDIFQNVKVSIVATDPNATEGNPATDLGTFLVTRTGDASADLLVEFRVCGSADMGPSDDYILSVDPAEADLDTVSVPPVLTIKAERDRVSITLTPQHDTEVEGPETAVIVLLDGDEYVVAPFRGATVTIADDDVPGDFDVVSPTDGQDEVDERAAIRLEWTDPTDAVPPGPLADTYVITYADNVNFTNSVVIGPQAGLFHDVPDDTFESDKHIWWTVTATNDAGDREITGGPLEFWTRDTIPPWVARFKPGGDADVKSRVEIGFSEPVTLTESVETVFAIQRAAPGDTPGTWQQVSAYKVIFTPSRDFAYDTAYTVTIVADYVEDDRPWKLDGDRDGAEGGDYTKTFRTWEELAGLAGGDGCTSGAGAGAACVMMALAALAVLRRRA